MGVFARHAAQSGRPRRLHVVAALTVLLLTGGGAVWALGGSAAPPLSITPGQHRMIDALESVLLHNTPSPLSGWIAHPRDGPGYVAGTADFTTSGGGILEVPAEHGPRTTDH